MFLELIATVSQGSPQRHHALGVQTRRRALTALVGPGSGWAGDDRRHDQQ